MTGRSDRDNPFDPRLIAAVVAVGGVAFIALWALVALGPQLSGGNDGGGHALSKAAPGFAGIVDLAERARADVELRRSVETATYDDHKPLLVLTPAADTDAEDVADILARQGNGPVLLVLPKWRTMPGTGEGHKPGWAGFGVPLPAPTRLLPLPDNAQTVSGAGLETLIPGANGGAVLARTSNREFYVLPEPDLLNNLAFASRDKAHAAAMLIDAVGEDAEAAGIAFDLTLNGFGGGRSLLRFAFVPPFIGITLCLIAAGLLALWQAWARFGPALRPARAIPISKQALIANSADLIRQARRELDGADAYVRSQRGAIARRLHAPGGLSAEETDAWIDRHLKADSASFATLARRLPLARNTHEFLADAQALHDIRKELLRDG